MSTAKTAVLLAQLGTPDAPTPQALRPYLKEFLSDPRVVDTNRVLWWAILNGIILRTRPRRSAALYQRIWTDRGSPLLFHTVDQTRGLQKLLGDTVIVDFAMRYGNPALPGVLDKLTGQGVDRILVFPMFPQYCAATTASVYDAFFDYIKSRRVVPTFRFVPPYPKHPAYIGALASIAREAIARLPWQPDKLLISFHGIPKRYVEMGDLYKAHVGETACALVEALQLKPDDYELTFQSRFGREEWLQPYTDDRLEAMAKSGVKRVAALCPGFTVDCLETIDEIGRESRHKFQEAGGEDLQLIPCLNSHPAWLEAMAGIAREELAGWTQFA